MPIAAGRRGRYNAAPSPPTERERMAIERTLSIIKPDATRRNLTGTINDRFEERGLRIVAQKRLRLTKETAEAFYAVHARAAVLSATLSPS